MHSKLVENSPLWRNYYPQNDFIYTLNASEQVRTKKNEIEHSKEIQSTTIPELSASDFIFQIHFPTLVCVYNAIGKIAIFSGFNVQK